MIYRLSQATLVGKRAANLICLMYSAKTREKYSGPRKGRNNQRILVIQFIVHYFQLYCVNQVALR